MHNPKTEMHVKDQTISLSATQEPGKICTWTCSIFITADVQNKPFIARFPHLT